MTRGRIRMPVVAFSLVVLLVASFVETVPGWVGILAVVLGLAVYARLGWPRRRAPVDVESPVRGRWRAVNSPADRTPSHGLHAYGQTYAIDLVHEPADGSRPAGGWWPLARRPDDYPGFGAPVHAPADGAVMAVHDRERDHWSRTSWPGLAYLLVESALREVTGPGRVLGNHVVLHLGGDVHALLAHLQRGSIEVRPGDRVDAGRPVARCGNSGNSTEPHLHLQLMDHARVVLADGVPFRFRGVEGAGEPVVPAREEPFTVAARRGSCVGRGEGGG